MISTEWAVDAVGAEAASEAENESCRACGAKSLIAFYEVTNLPAQTTVLLDTEDEAKRFPAGEILLAFCPTCGFIQNVRFHLELVDYSKPTEESQAFSPRFTEFATGLADHLMDRYGLAGKSVLEIGCGKGDFLQLLAERGVGSALGLDPGYLPNRELDDGSIVEYRRDWFGADDTHLTGDLVITRHLMEHVPNVGEFFSWLAESARNTPDSAVFTEVPDTARVLAEGAFWDVYHEHCSYFTIGSLARSIRAAGMTVTDLTYGFEDQYLLAESLPSSVGESLPNEDTPQDIARLVAKFVETTKSTVRRWRSRIERVQAEGGKVAVWGGGSKAVAFLSSVGAAGVDVVDINPHKQGKWLPGAAVEVQPPEILKTVRPYLVVPMNPIYVDEITRDLHEMGLSPTVEAL